MEKMPGGILGTSKIVIMLLKAFPAALIMTIFSCSGTESREISYANTPVTKVGRDIFYEKIGAIPLPEGYQRESLAVNSFGHWLRNIDLKQDNTVYLYNGTPKRNQAAQFAVLDISVGDKDLQQCADAAMRLRAEYLYDLQKYKKIRFVDNAGGVYQFNAPYSRDAFHQYLNRVFGMCGTASLSKQLPATTDDKLVPGDLLLKGGFPGHAVMIVDMAINEAGEKIFLLAQSYMPAQDIHVLVNPADPNLSPWYRLGTESIIETPEWTFNNNQFKTW
jgi:hypothetical protein